MGKVIVCVSVDLVLDMIQQGACHGGYEVIHGIPEGSQVKDARHRYDRGGVIEMVIEHDSWPETPPGMPYPILTPVFRRLDAQKE
jgi:hypothetical protein